MNVFKTLPLKLIFRKTKIFFKKLEDHFSVESTNIASAKFPRKTACQKPMLRQTEWGVQNLPIAKNGVLPITTLYFWKICFNMRNSYKELIWCINYSDVHINTFRKGLKFTWGCFFLCVCLNFLFISKIDLVDKLLLCFEKTFIV